MASSITKFGHLKIPLEDVVKATNKFHDDNIIGHGGFGTAYKGRLLLSGEAIKIAARRLDRKHKEGAIEFWTEVSLLCDLNHTNLVSIIGFCDEKDEKIIITTYEANGSLEEHLVSSNLTWMQRLKISVGVARALSYLHYDYERRGYAVIHRNINSYTVLLDENWEAKLSGFEISIKQSFNQMDQVVLCEPIGTIGYMDPAIEKTRGVTHKSDIYSFGVVLFELMCGRKAFIKNEANRFLTRLVKYHYENRTPVKDIIHPHLWNQMSPRQSLVKYLKVAYSCLKEERTQRPNIDFIVSELEKALELQLRRENLEKLEHLKIPLSDIKLATENFSETYKIGVTGYCTLYRAELNNLDKENTSSVEGKAKGELPKRHDTVVIKRILPRDDEQGEFYFFTEIEMLTSVKHRKIVGLLGFCVEGSQMILVIDNISNGYLGNYMENGIDMCRVLTWEKRLKFCIDVAHALNYLHFEMEDKRMIINRDIKSYNIGLDENWGAMIAEFGLSIFLPPNQEDEALYINTIVGTNYYIDPEYDMTCKLKRESDAYSFGVVLFEILCGRLAYDSIYLRESEKGLAFVARQCLCTGTLQEMIDLITKDETGENNFIRNKGLNKESLHTFCEIAYQCVAETQDQRPTMKVVVKQLEKALRFQLSQEERLQLPDTNQLVNELGNTLELQLTHENIPEEHVQPPNMVKVVDEFEKTLEAKLTHGIFGNNLDIRLSDIKLATQNFSETYKTAFFDYSTLYRAELDCFDKENPSPVVIKRFLPRDDEQGKEAFYTNIEMLNSVKHRSIVTLLGLCVEGSEMILVLENVSNGYLVDYLEHFKDRRILTWEKRLKICIDVASAMEYLHYEKEDQKMIINRNIRSHNIGLDENWGAKMVDFGLSVFLPLDQEDEALYLTTIVGVNYYTDPQYEKTGKLKRESDVYSFGVVLFEVLCGRLAHDPIYLKESKEGLASVARRHFRMGTLEEMIDPIIKEESGEKGFIPKKGPNKDSLNTFIEIAYQCVAETQDQRPTMKIVIKQLEKALFLQENNKDNPKISLEDIKCATNNFHDDNCIGGGGFGNVYIGNLQDGDGVNTIVAKRLDTRSGQGEKQFLSEIQILLEYKHENIVRLVGYCDEKDEKIIVYEYASRKSLDGYLKNVSLTWLKRLNICIDVASALDFLQEGVGKQAKVIHRDIKTANILLSDDWKAKLADFGLSLISPINEETDYVIDYACGTPGYLDPLYRKSGFLTVESDIYSFGVVLFEILCGRSTFTIKKHEGHYLPDFIKNKFEEGKHDEVVFEQIREQIVPKSLTTFLEIAYQSLHHEREKRPKTKKVLMQLKKALEFQNMASTMTKFATLKIPLEGVVKATNDFHDDNIIGHNGFGTIYKGHLLRPGRLMNIAARRFNCKHGEGDLEFLTEVSMLCELNHTNLVSIIGFCDEKDEKIIITTYEANGSLGDYLNNMNLTWTQRLRICVGLAHALSYLHYDKERDYGIIHCNINSDSILLDENLETKLSGFEISLKQSVYYKDKDKDKVYLCEHIGTMGCMDPAIVTTGGVTHKSDIYSFGVVLFEILCRRKVFIQNEAPWAIRHYENGTLQDIVHPDLWNQMSPQSLFKYSKAAYSCLQEERTHRPNADNIVDILEKALESQQQHEFNGKRLEHLMIRLSNIKLATDNFSKPCKIGVTTYYTLYTARVGHVDMENPSFVNGKNECELPTRHNTVVIKRILPRDDEQGEEVFFKEIEMLTSVKHPNIVTLLGFSVDGSEMILVTENFSNGYLGYYLKDVNAMRIFTWEKRLKICIDVAHALNYLHYEMKDDKIIINRDIKSKNIALDENWEAKIADFGVSLFLPPNQEDEALYPEMMAGTPLYWDPEYEKTGKLKRESDVYSFGVVLFEILCGRLTYDPIYKESGKGLASMARQSFCAGTLYEMIDPVITEETTENSCTLNKGPNKDSLHTFIEIAYQCVTETQDQHPTMKVVVKELEKALFFQENNPRIRLEDIKVTTQNVHDDNCNDGEGSGKIYKGNLQDGDGVNTIVAKPLKTRFGQEENQFVGELQVLWEYKHENVIDLVGYSDEHDG